jgi:farnesyl-diphosphate farnesyltransferase
MPASTLLTDLLRDVSRSFYLTLRVLPSSIRPQIALAYLLARTTDTIADTTIVPLERRLNTLHLLTARIQGTSRDPLNLDDFTSQRSDVASSPNSSARDATATALTAERLLLQRVPDALALLDTFTPDDRQRVRNVLSTIVSGQELDLTRFSVGSPDRIVALDTEADLDDYTYRVAGAVGEFWTHTCRAHVFPHAPLNMGVLLQNAVRFGKGLQLVNILRDLPTDLRQGRCYLPANELNQLGIAPQDLLDPRTESTFRPLFNRYLDLADAHLTAARTYVNHVPWRCVRVRLACAWPVLLGAKTLELLRRSPILDLQYRVKVSRRALESLVAMSIVLYPFPGAWRKLLINRNLR